VKRSIVVRLRLERLHLRQRCRQLEEEEVENEVAEGGRWNEVDGGGRIGNKTGMYIYFTSFMTCVE